MLLGITIEKAKSVMCLLRYRRGHPVFQFSAPLEQFLSSRKSDILPAKIIEEM